MTAQSGPLLFIELLRLRFELKKLPLRAGHLRQPSLPILPCPAATPHHRPGLRLSQAEGEAGGADGGWARHGHHRIDDQLC